VFFEQMKGRGTRTISPTDLAAVTPDASHKTHFIIVDAVGVCEKDKTDSQPLERKRSVPFDKLLMSVALGNRDDDTLTSLAGRLSRMQKELDETETREIESAAEGRALKEIVNGLLDAVDPDKKEAKARELYKTEEPTREQVKKAEEELKKTACSIFDIPNLRDKIIEIKRRDEQIIDTISRDTATFAGFDIQAREKTAHDIIDRFKKFIEENKDELTALQIIYSKPYGVRHLTFEQIRSLAEAIKKPPYNLTTDNIWSAYEQLEKSKVKHAGPQKLLTNMVSLIRFARG
jgi:type I restriction enzyme R subunit